MATVYNISHFLEGLTVAMPDGNPKQVGRGEALETTTEHAASLLEQVDTWSATPPRGKRSSHAPAASTVEEGGEG